jgi:S-adenosylmethionine:tRNA ribosyltransferase-isomerase
MYRIDDYDYALPEDLVAQVPAKRRGQSRLMHLCRRSGRITHRTFDELAELLGSGDLLVVNNTRVIPGRLVGHKPSGGRVEVLILDYAQSIQQPLVDGSMGCRCLVKASKPPAKGSRLRFEQGLWAEVLSRRDGVYQLRFSPGRDFTQLVRTIGQVPLPPYIKRGQGSLFDDRSAYQTVYARNDGAIAAPTAGLHFSEALLAQLRQQGVQMVEITLHVGYGTFLPVRVNDIREHRMHSEWFSIPAEAAAALNAARAAGKRIVCVGTTTVRTLEFMADASGWIRSGLGACDLFIYAGYRFKVVDAMITNFHLPQSTLLMLVSAFTGRQQILAAYTEAIMQRYRFFSYGDAMFIE